MQIVQQEKEKKVQTEENQFVEIIRIDGEVQIINNYQDKLKQLNNKIDVSLSKIQFNIIGSSQKMVQSQKGSASHTNIRQLKNKKKKVIIQQVSSNKQNNFSVDKIHFMSSCKQLERNPSLKKITRFQKNSQEFDQTASLCLKRVKFDQKMEDLVLLEKNDEKLLKDEIKQLNTFYKKIRPQQNTKQIKKQNFMQFICSIFSFKNIFRKRNNNKLQIKILGLNQLKITGSREQVLMLKLIAKFYLLDQLKVQDQLWQRIGFKTQKPLKQLQKTGALMLLQWINFIVFDQKLSTKIFNFCVEMSFSLYQFHLIVTQVYCRQLIECKFSGCTWEQYQQIYNLLVVNSSEQLFERFKNKPENIQKIITQIVSNCGKKLKVINQKKDKKKSVKISPK